jgi:adenylate kinase family enzyme
VNRFVVVGSSGSGKTTTARAISERLGIPHVELDALYHQPDWKPTPDDELLAAVADAVAGEAWVVDGNYSATRPITWPRARTIVWLDYPKSLVMRRVVGRTLRRVVNREELWNGNREPWTNLYRLDPERNIIRWAWANYDGYRERYLAAQEDPTWDHLDWVVHRSPAETEQWLAAL